MVFVASGEILSNKGTLYSLVCRLSKGKAGSLADRAENTIPISNSYRVRLAYFHPTTHTHTHKCTILAYTEGKGPRDCL